MKEKTRLPGNISDRVRDLREEWGLTRKELAQRSGVDESLLGESYRVWLVTERSGEYSAYEAFPAYEAEKLGEAGGCGVISGSICVRFRFCCRFIGCRFFGGSIAAAGSEASCDHHNCHQQGEDLHHIL